MKTWMCALMLALSTGASAQNPIISGQYSADPTARVFNGKATTMRSPADAAAVMEWWIEGSSMSRPPRGSTATVQ